MTLPKGDEILYEYTLPPETVSKVAEGTANISSGLPSEVPSQFTGDGAQTNLYSIIERMSDALNVDLISILHTVIIVTVIVVGTLVAAKIINRLLAAHVPKLVNAEKMGFDSETERTFRTITRRLLVATVYVIGIILVVDQIEPLSKMAVTLLAGAGVAGIAIGFAAQSSLSNVVSGIFLAVFHPIRVGDYVDFNGEYGHIEDLTLRHTVILTWDGRRIVVPNSIMDNQAIINWSIVDPVITWPINIGIAYTADIDKARDIMMDAAMRHPLVMKNHEIMVRVTQLGDFAVNMRLYVDVPSRNVAYTTACDITEAVKKRFDKEGVEIPYPYRNVIIQPQQSAQALEEIDDKENQAS